MEAKDWKKSKTLIANGVALAASLIATFGGFEIPPEMQAELVLGIFAMVNIGLRLVTDEPLKKGDKKGQGEMPVSTQDRKVSGQTEPRTAMDEKEAPLYGYHKVEK